jgi:hypothetical protein
VFLARHKETHRNVAIKWIQNVFKTTYDFKKVLREVQIMS